MHEDLSVIEVNVEGSKPRAILDRLLEQVQSIVSECMKSLICFPAVLFSRSGEPSSAASLTLDESSFLIPLSLVQSCVETKATLYGPGPGVTKVLTWSEAETH